MTNMPPSLPYSTHTNSKIHDMFMGLIEKIANLEKELEDVRLLVDIDFEDDGELYVPFITTLQDQ